MSHQGESSLQKFQHFIKWLQSAINKGIDNNLITIEIKEAIETHPNSRDVKKKSLLHLRLWKKQKEFLLLL
jgi:hypothetical protein